MLPFVGLRDGCVDMKSQYCQTQKHMDQMLAVHINPIDIDNDLGPNTGGMGSYKDVDSWLPFTGREEWEREKAIESVVKLVIES